MNLSKTSSGMLEKSTSLVLILSKLVSLHSLIVLIERTPHVGICWIKYQPPLIAVHFMQPYNGSLWPWPCQILIAAFAFVVVLCKVFFVSTSPLTQNPADIHDIESGAIPKLSWLAA